MPNNTASAGVEAQIDDYKEQCKKEAEKLVKVTFPEKVVELNKFLESEQFSLNRLPELNIKLNIPLPDAILLNNDAPSNKKRKMEDGTGLDIGGTKVTIFPGGSVASSPVISELHEIVKPYIRALLDQSNKIKMWIAYLIPKIEDGNNFGVSIQEDILAEARQVEGDVATYIDSITRYYLTRGKVVSKVAKYPHVEDYRRSVIELDEKEFINLRVVMAELRNYYASLHDMIIKNWDKIIKPRNQHTDNMY